MSAIRKTVTYDHPIAAVWFALTDADAIGRWLMPVVGEFEPVDGHVFGLRTDPAPGFDGSISCRITEVSEPTRLVHTWTGGNIDTVVSYDLRALSEARTELTLVQTGFRGPGAFITKLFLSFGWKRRILTRTLPDELAASASSNTQA